MKNIKVNLGCKGGKGGCSPKPLIKSEKNICLNQNYKILNLKKK